MLKNSKRCSYKDKSIDHSNKNIDIYIYLQIMHSTDICQKTKSIKSLIYSNVFIVKE